VSANNNREPWMGPVVDKVPALASNQVWVHDCRVYGPRWHTDRDTCASCGKARPVAEKPAKAAEPTRTSHATPADVTMLWEAIDQLKARIDALDMPPRYVGIRTPFATDVGPKRVAAIGSSEAEKPE